MAFSERHARGDEDKAEHLYADRRHDVQPPGGELHGHPPRQFRGALDLDGLEAIGLGVVMGAGRPRNTRLPAGRRVFRGLKNSCDGSALRNRMRLDDDSGRVVRPGDKVQLVVRHGR